MFKRNTAFRSKHVLELRLDIVDIITPHTSTTKPVYYHHRLPSPILGNKTARMSCHIISACINTRTPCALENPDTSLLWRCPPIARLPRHPSCRVARFCMCAFGTRWRKATKVAAWHVDVSKLDRMCHRSKGLCEFSNKMHIPLTGKDKATGRNWTSIACPYPPRLGSALASALVNAANIV